MTYDSKPDTLAHIKRVGHLLRQVSYHLHYRAYVHDFTKLHEPEKSAFDRETPKLRELTYGSEEYNESKARLGAALVHHYRKNRHHPEHFCFDDDGVLDPERVKDGTGIRSMNLEDLIEMLCDWKAASERHENGNIYASIEMNQARFGYSDDLKQILVNTARSLNWE